MILTIDEEFKNLIPPLTNEEFQQLEENILRDGIREPLVIWDNVLIDGHNRYAIAQKHNLPFATTELHFDNRGAAIEWIIQNQFGRRNISTFDRICLALKLKPLISANSKQRMLKGTSDSMPNLAQGTTNEQIAKLAGVGKETVRKVEKILELSKQVNLDDVIAGLKKGDISISLAYEAAIYRKQDLDKHAEKIKAHIAKAKENYLAFKKCYDEFYRRFELMTPAEKEKFAEEKKELDEGLKFCKALGVEELFDNYDEYL